MSLRLRVLPAAADDVGAAKQWYEKQREGLGAEFVEEINAAMELVADNPLWRPAEISRMSSRTRQSISLRYPLPSLGR